MSITRAFYVTHTNLSCVTPNIQTCSSLQPFLMQQSQARIFIVHSIIAVSIVTIIIPITKPPTLRGRGWLGLQTTLKSSTVQLIHCPADTQRRLTLQGMAAVSSLLEPDVVRLLGLRLWPAAGMALPLPLTPTARIMTALPLPLSTHGPTLCTAYLSQGSFLLFPPS